MNPVNKSYRIKENSFIAKLAAAKLKGTQMAIVIGNTIHLHNVSKEEFLNCEDWVRHEECHIKQFKEHGFIPFLCKYVWESAKKGYYNNKYEAEARNYEKLEKENFV